MGRRLLLICLALLAALAVFGGLFLVELHQPYQSDGGGEETETFVTIPPGAGARDAAERLRAGGALHTRLPFILWLRYRNADRAIKAGEYRFTGADSPIDVADRITRGDTYYRAITIPEGLTAEETVGLLARNGFGDIERLQESLTRTEWVRDIAPAARDLEGFLFPQTYRFGHLDDEDEVVHAMVRQFREQMDAIAARTPLPDGWTVSRVVTLASLIEKEAKASEERALVSSVLVNRLDRNIALGCDATIIYAMKLAGTWDGNIRKSDLQMPSSYNSYIHRGLPPGPICNPGAASIEAALAPARTDYLYYVSKNDGTHQFSRTLGEHNAAVNRYQRRR
ncbi:MAG: endolytic transglycosylase MltG [Acidobacteriota bacterium]|jgi:UPF0755 protein|nr:endolytic transglycosylase MltG [Acidobacteriota bacterium]